jgi:minichromosome maintenance protein 10
MYVLSIASTTDLRWPPKSPHDVLLSTPSGRNRLRQMEERLSPSPSPLKRTISTPSFRRRAERLVQPDNGVQDNDEDEEDEETLQLQLQAIEAKLKLKKLRQAKAKGTISSSDVENDGRGSSQLSKRMGSVAARANSALEARQKASETAKTLQRTRSQPDVQVPLSPPRQARKIEEPRSPGRVLLGIDKGLKGRDMSLRRAPSLRGGNDRNLPTAGGLGSTRATSSLTAKAEERPKSFNERMAEARVEDRFQKEKEQKILRSRSKGFGVGDKELEQYKNEAAAQQSILLSPPTTGPPEFGREEVLRAAGTANTSTLRRSKTVSSIRMKTRNVSDDKTASTSTTSTLHCEPSFHARSSSLTYPLQSPPILSHDPDLASPTNSLQDSSQFDTFSSLHLSKRILPHGFLTRQLAGKHIYLIPDLLKTVKSPSYDPPDVEGDWIVFGIIASKSTPLDHKGDGRKVSSSSGENDNSSQRGKYMAITLTDLKWEITLYLFDSAFERFWKLTPGSVIALLNPNVMPPRPGQTDTGCFSLTLNSSDDTVLEIGVARDLNWCKSMQRDGKQCFRWIDRRHTEFCTFHIDAKLKKVKAGRMEVNTMTAPFAPGGSGKSRFFGGAAHRSRGAATAEPNPKQNGLRTEGAVHSRVTGTYFITPSITNRSTAALLDDNDVDPDAFHRGTSREERLRRRLVERDREREIARKLGENGGGVGSEYLRAGNAADAKTQAHPDPNLATDPRSMESLTGGRAEEIRLSPIKRKRGASQASGSAPPASSGVGWSFKNVGNMLRKGGPALSLREGDTIKEPVRKKTRFVTAKGIREAGRESFGGEVVRDEADGDDDDLDII